MSQIIGIGDGGGWQCPEGQYLKPSLILGQGGGGLCYLLCCKSLVLL